MPSSITWGGWRSPSALPVRRLLAAATALLLSSAATLPAFAQPGSGATVLTIHTEEVDNSINPVLDAGIRDALRADAARPVSYFAEYLELNRLSEQQTASALGDYIRRKYAGRRIDVVIAMRERAVQFVLEQRARLFPDASIVVASHGLAGDNRGAVQMTGVRFANAYSATLSAALQLHPNVRRVFVVATSPDPRKVEILREELQRFSTRVKLTYLHADTFEHLIATVKALPRGTLLLYVWYQSPGADSVNSAAARVRQLAEAAPVPVYAGFESLVGTGVVGGMVPDVRGTGVRVGEIARQIVNGTPPADIPVVDAPAVPVFDWRELRRWVLDPQKLPRGADIRFRGRTAWQQYRWLIVAVIVVGAQMVLIAALLKQRAQRHLVEKVLLSREATLRASYYRTRQLAGALIHAQEAARIAMARDLHDDICQEVIGVAMSIDTMTRSSGRIQDPKNQYALAKLHQEILGVAGHLRLISHELHPATLQLLGLAPAVKAHCLEVEARYQAEVALHMAGDMTSIHPTTALCLFRIAQESMRNAVVHGAALHFEVSLTRFGDDIELVIRDDGRGFDVDTARRESPGLGLLSMDERVHTVGGEVMIWSEPGQGTTVLACVPAGVVPQTQIDITDEALAAPYDDEAAAGASPTGSQWTGQSC